jgi:O-antigen/teichoic acid export membrane protein
VTDNAVTTAEPPATSGLGAGASMTGRVVRGANWSASSRLYSQGLQFVVGIALARLLVPKDFGLLASVYVISGFAVMFFELGLGSALIHRRHPSEQEKATVFWVNVIGGVLFAGLLAAGGHLVADFYREPALVWLTPLQALSFTLSFGVVHNAMLQSELRFKAIATIEIIAATAGQATTLVAAVLGAGAYSLVCGPLVSSLLVSVFSVTVVRWRPRHFISLAALRQLWTFSGGLLGFNIVNYWGRNADNLLVGRVLGASPLGLYSKAYNLMLLPIQQVTGALARVMFPALSAIQDDPPRVRAAYLRTLNVINAATIPGLLGLAATADALVPLLWGDRWTATVPILQILCLAGVPQCVTASLGWIYQSQGQTGLMFRMGLVGAIVGVAAIVIGLHWGVVGVAWGVLFRYWVMMPWGIHTAGRVIGLKARTVLANARPVFVSSTLMGVAVWLVPFAVGGDRDAAWLLGVQVPVGAIVYAGCLLLFARPLLRDVRNVVRRRSA